jgi:hypothetical protein
VSKTTSKKPARKSTSKRVSSPARKQSRAKKEDTLIEDSSLTSDNDEVVEELSGKKNKTIVSLTLLIIDNFLGI